MRYEDIRTYWGVAACSEKKKQQLYGHNLMHDSITRIAARRSRIVDRRRSANKIDQTKESRDSNPICGAPGSGATLFDTGRAALVFSHQCLTPSCMLQRQLSFFLSFHNPCAQTKNYIDSFLPSIVQKSHLTITLSIYSYPTYITLKNPPLS